MCCKTRKYQHGNKNEKRTKKSAVAGIVLKNRKPNGGSVCYNVPFLLSDSRCLARSVKNSGLYSDRFTQTIFEREEDSFCRSLASIRKYYLNLWSTMCMSMSAVCVTKARMVSSGSYSYHDVNCNYMQDAT
jgi:hypothetical protein